MKNLPKIILKKDLNLKEEIDLFYSFLHHPYYKQNRVFILKAFPELKKLSLEDEKQNLKLFISGFYKDNEKKIKKIIKKNKELLDRKLELSLKTLLKIMNYHYAQPITYYAIPTILPFSPYKNNTFYFSILGEIKNKTDKNILIIGIHEISHIIFLDQLRNIERIKNIILPEDLKSYLKEALAVIILNQEPLSTILKLKNYQGNPEIQNLKIQEKNKKNKKFTEFLNNYYVNITLKEKKSFVEFLEKIIDILVPVMSEFSKKRLIWNKYGRKTLRDPKIITLYSKPIKI